MSKLLPAPVGGTGYWSISPSFSNEIELADDVRVHRKYSKRFDGREDELMELVFRNPVHKTLPAFTLNDVAAVMLYRNLGEELRRCGLLEETT